MKFTIELSKRGIPCVWEKGGAYTNTGRCELICDMNGNAKKPIYIRTRGSLACEEHALIPVRTNDYIVKAFQHREDFDIDIFQVKEIDTEEKIAELELVNIFSKGEWDSDIEGKFLNVIEAAKKKATSYHCRSAYFIKQD